MSDYNKNTANWYKAQGTFMTGSGNATTSQAVLHELSIGTYTPGAVIRVANGTATSKTYLSGSYTPNGLGLQKELIFKELEFTSGIYVEITGTAHLTAVYNDIT
jgi:hypothetical protein